MSAPLSFDEAFEILRPALPDDRLVLVGGQAVNYWLTYYRNRVASLAGLAGVTSDDVDFFGTVQAARRVAETIHGTLRQGTLDDHGPSAATVTFTDAGGTTRVIDFLSAVHGLDDDAKIRDTALPVEILDPLGQATGIELKILHPIYCLCSRVHNTHTFTKYQTPRALNQLRAALGCARGFLVDQCEAAETRSAHNAIRIVARLANQPAGRSVYERFGVDVLDAIPEDPRLGSAFIQQRLPKLRARLKRR